MLFRIFLFLQVFNPSLLQKLESASNPIVFTPLGQYQGSVLTSRFGKPIYSFRGIRYAEAPVNDLRFKPPVGVKNHEGVYNAMEDGAVCPQPTVDPVTQDLLFPNVGNTKVFYGGNDIRKPVILQFHPQFSDPVSEDCLFLNVYSTKLPKGYDYPRRPVIIYIHPGGFYSGTGRSNWAGPQYFMDQDIVLVTFNYRLGALGFLSTGDENAPGNNGLKDQVLTMKWVKQNIGSFGGDPNSITLIGCGTSISLHLMSPMTKGLFHKAIIGSGSALGHWPLGNSQMEVSKRQARVVGCPDNNSTVIFECLKGKSADELGRSLVNMTEFGNEPVLIWKPVIEKYFGQERFLTDHPVNLARQGKFHKMPIMAGVTTDEFAGRAYVMLYADAQGWPIDRTVKLLADKNTEPVYYYRFNFMGRFSHFYISGTPIELPYVVHHDDLIYLFCISTLFPKFGKTDSESPTVNKLTTMWANFARTGKPIPETCGRLDFAEWEPFDLKSQKYMDIDSRLRMKSKQNADRYAEWRKLFEFSDYYDPASVEY